MLPICWCSQTEGSVLAAVIVTNAEVPGRSWRNASCVLMVSESWTINSMIISLTTTCIQNVNGNDFISIEFIDRRCNIRSCFNDDEWSLHHVNRDKRSFMSSKDEYAILYEQTQARSGNDCLSSNTCCQTVVSLLISWDVSPKSNTWKILFNL